MSFLVFTVFFSVRGEEGGFHSIGVATEVYLFPLFPSKRGKVKDCYFYLEEVVSMVNFLSKKKERKRDLKGRPYTNNHYNCKMKKVMSEYILKVPENISLGFTSLNVHKVPNQL